MDNNVRKGNFILYLFYISNCSSFSSSSNLCIDNKEEEVERTTILKKNWSLI